MQRLLEVRIDNLDCSFQLLQKKNNKFLEKFCLMLKMIKLLDGQSCVPRGGFKSSVTPKITWTLILKNI